VQKVEKDYLYKSFHVIFRSLVISKIKHFTRIKTTKEFNVVYKKPTKICHTPCFVIFFKKNDKFTVGFVASKKVGNAVHRNRAKRLLRAHFIENIDLITSGSYVLVAKPDIISRNFLDTKKSYLHALKKCSALI